MKSSTGTHYIAIDHVRALAAFMVFTWHFTHGSKGFPVSFEYVPSVMPLALLDEGHTGVALFMTLSGYLFAKILNGKSIDFGAFIWNRALRLFPLLFVVILTVGLLKLYNGENLHSYLLSLVKGVIYPSLPNGGWSITVEFHYYLILPIVLWTVRRSLLSPLVAIMAAIAARVIVYQIKGEIQTFAYATILGRFDQFALGMLMYHYRDVWSHRHLVVLSILSAFTFFYWYFDSIGGYYQNPSYPSPSPLWIFLPTIEAFAYAIGIAWYDNSFSHSDTGLSRLIGRVGEYSYSIYLLHFFVVFRIARFIHEQIMDISTFPVACFWSAIVFVSMTPLGYLSYRYIEAPFLKLRKKYILASTVRVESAIAALPRQPSETPVTGPA